MPNLTNIVPFYEFALPGILIIAVAKLFANDHSRSPLESLVFSGLSAFLYRGTLELSGISMNDNQPWYTYLGTLIILPVLIGIAVGINRQQAVLHNALKFIKIKTMHPIKSSWDYAFSRTKTGYIEVKTVDGETIAGFFGVDSFSSTDEKERDIFLERVYREEGTGDKRWVEYEISRGILIKAEHIASISFLDEAQNSDVKEKTDKDRTAKTE